MSLVYISLTPCCTRLLNVYSIIVLQQNYFAGFSTAVKEAVKAIHSGVVESRSCPDTIAIVKLMGRSSGFIAAHAALASGDVDLCLVPEVPLVMDGPQGALCHIESCLDRTGHAVVVVAEGAGQDVLPPYVHFGCSLLERSISICLCL